MHTWARRSSVSSAPGGTAPWVWLGGGAQWPPLVACLCLTSSSFLQRDCQNYIKILLPLNSSHLIACGTEAFSPACTYIVSALLHPGPAPGWPRK